MTEPSQVIATREFEAGAGRTIVVELYAPEPDPEPNGDFRCGHRISGSGWGEGKVRYTFGVDSMQALFLALQMIGALLYTSEEAKAGHLTWLGGTNLGLPLSKSIRDLEPDSDAI